MDSLKRFMFGSTNVSVLLNYTDNVWLQGKKINDTCRVSYREQESRGRTTHKKDLNKSNARHYYCNSGVCTYDRRQFELHSRIDLELTVRWMLTINFYLQKACVASCLLL